jgi:hypothetical protein
MKSFGLTRLDVHACGKKRGSASVVQLCLSSVAASGCGQRILLNGGIGRVFPRGDGWSIGGPNRHLVKGEA